MWEAIIVKPIFNLLVTIWALLPGHDLGVALIIFTLLIRLLLWPVVFRQIKQARKMRDIQPQLKAIKAKHKGNRQQEAAAAMELYRQQGFNPFASLGYLLIQIPIFIALFQGINRITSDTSAIYQHSYGFLNDSLAWIGQVSQQAASADMAFLGLVDLARPAVGDAGLYQPAMIVVIISAVAQYFLGRQMISFQSPDNQPGTKPQRVRDLLKQQAAGKEIDQAELNQAMGRLTVYILPFLLLVVSLRFVAALTFYWFVSSLIAYFQQAKAASRLQTTTVAAKSGSQAITGHIVGQTLNAKQKKEARQRATVSRQVQAAQIVTKPSPKNKNKT